MSFDAYIRGWGASQNAWDARQDTQDRNRRRTALEELSQAMLTSGDVEEGSPAWAAFNAGEYGLGREAMAFDQQQQDQNAARAREAAPVALQAFQSLQGVPAGPARLAMAQSYLERFRQFGMPVDEWAGQIEMVNQPGFLESEIAELQGMGFGPEAEYGVIDGAPYRRVGDNIEYLERPPERVGFNDQTARMNAETARMNAQPNRVGPAVGYNPPPGHVRDADAPGGMQYHEIAPGMFIPASLTEGAVGALETPAPTVGIEPNPAPSGVSDGIGDRAALADAREQANNVAPMNNLLTEMQGLIVERDTGRLTPVLGEASRLASSLGVGGVFPGVEGYAQWFEQMHRVSQRLGAEALQLFGGSDTERELAVALETTIRTQNRPETNIAILSDQMAAARTMMERPALMSAWIASNGALGMTDAQGRTWDEWWSGYQLSRYAQLRMAFGNTLTAQRAGEQESGIRNTDRASDRVRSGQGGSAPRASSTLQVGQIEDGYRYVGGDPNSPESWERVQ